MNCPLWHPRKRCFRRRHLVKLSAESAPGLAVATDIPVRCACGNFAAVASEVSPRVVNFGYCYCDDCQLFQHALDKADQILDANGGTAIFQMSPAKFRVTEGLEHLACLQLRPGGLIRWYTTCCDTPVGNTMGTPKLPFVGVLTASVDPTADRKSVDAALGPIRFRVHGRFCKGRCAWRPSKSATLVDRPFPAADVRLAKGRRRESVTVFRRDNGSSHRAASRVDRRRAAPCHHAAGTVDLTRRVAP